MLSRVADSLYWMSRYLERAEHTTRLLDVNLNLMLDETAASAERRWQRVLQALGRPKDIEWTGEPYSLTQALTFDTEQQGFDSFLHHRRARELAACQRADFDRAMAPAEQPLSAGDAAGDANRKAGRGASPTGITRPSEFLQSVMEAVHQFQGVTDSTMNHGEGWQFIQVGRYIERASATALLLEAYHADLWEHPERVGEGNEYLDWMGLLRSATAFEAYCKVYTADLTPDRIFEFLLLDEEFPHSVRFSIDSVQCALEKIQGDSGKSRAEALQRLERKAAGVAELQQRR